LVGFSFTLKKLNHCLKCVTEYTQNFEIKLSFGTSSLLHFSCKNEKKLSNKEKTKQPCLIEQHINY